MTIRHQCIIFHLDEEDKFYSSHWRIQLSVLGDRRVGVPLKNIEYIIKISTFMKNKEICFLIKVGCKSILDE